MDVCRFSEARYRSQVFTPPCVQSSATPPPSLQVGLTLSSSFAPRPLSKLMALSLASVFNSRVSSRLFPWTNSKPWCLLTIYLLSGKRIATYHKVLPDSKKNWYDLLSIHNKSGAKRTNLIVCHEKKEHNISVLQLIGTKRIVEFLKTPLSPRAPTLAGRERAWGKKRISENICLL